MEDFVIRLKRAVEQVVYWHRPSAAPMEMVVSVALTVALTEVSAEILVLT
jgi:hypothetical protein